MIKRVQYWLSEWYNMKFERHIQTVLAVGIIFGLGWVMGDMILNAPPPEIEAEEVIEEVIAEGE